MKKVLTLLLLVAFSLGINAQQTVLPSATEAKRDAKRIQTNRATASADKSAVAKLPEGISKQKMSNQFPVGNVAAPAYTKSGAGPMVVTPGNAKIILAAGDVWADGTGYQMLIDADATAYGTIIPTDNNLSTEGDVPASVYAQFEYKIPTNADGSLTTTNIVFNNAIAIEVPAGTYDYCITNPSPGDKMYIAGGTLARGDDFVFEDGKVYTFTAVRNGNNDIITMTSAIAAAPSSVTALTVTPVGQTLAIDLAWTNPALTADADALTELTSVVVERNGTVVYTLPTPVVGAAATWTDNVPADGSYTYTIYGVNSAGNGIPVTATVFAGNVILMGSVATVNSCGTLFTDDGGPDGNYAEYTEENYTQMISFLPDVANKLVRATFTEFNTVVDFDADALYIVNGNYTDIADVPDEAIIDMLYGDLSAALPISYTSDSPDGALTFIFIRDSWGFYSPTSGWMATMDCVTPPNNDAGLTAVLSPVSAASDTYTLSVNIKNFGVNAITSMDMKYEVDGAAAVTQTYTGNLGMFETADFQFTTPITFPDYGTASVKVYTSLTADENPDNDTLEVVVVYRPAVTLYAYRTYGGDKGFVSFASNESQDMATEQVYSDGSNSMRGGEYLNGELYAYTATSSAPANFVKLSENWTQISSVTTNGSPNDVAYDHATGTMYAVAGANLYTVDKWTGAFTEVTTALPATFLTLACNLSGQLYGTTTDGGFYSIDKTTGTATLISQTGYTARYIQSMAFDHNTGRLFWAYIDYDGVTSNLMEIDPTTGECVILGSLGNTVSELLMLYTPYMNPALPEAPADFVATPDAAGDLSCELTWTNPALTTDGTALTDLTSIVIRRNNVIVQTINTPTIGAAASWTDNTIADGGNYTYAIYGVNTAGEGLIATQTVRVGCIQAINTFPWTMGFEGNVIPGCWTQEYVSGTNISWVTASGNGSYPAAAHTGTYNAVFKNASSTPNVVKLVTPKLDITGLANPTLTFWHTQAAWSGDQDELRVYYKTSTAGAWTLLNTYTSDIQAWTEQVIILPNASDDYYVAFEGTAKYGRGIALDDIRIETTTTGINDVTGSNIKVYPNPATDKIVIENAVGAQAKIYDLSGKVVLDTKIQNATETIDINQIARGAYFIELQDQQSKSTMKLIKQ